MYEYHLSVLLSLLQSISWLSMFNNVKERNTFVSSLCVHVSVVFAGTHYVYSLVLFTLPCPPETSAWFPRFGISLINPSLRTFLGNSSLS